MRTPILIFLAVLIILSCNNSNENKIAAVKKNVFGCTDDCKAKNSSTNLSCKLTSEEMQKRRTTVLESLRRQMLDKKELPDGYAFKFNGSDKMFDELTEFIKTERECCDFLIFNLSIGGDKNEIWLQVTGPEKAKEFITTEMQL